MPQGHRQSRKMLRDASKGGGGDEGFQKNVHLTFLEDKIDM